MIQFCNILHYYSTFCFLRYASGTYIVKGMEYLNAMQQEFW
jgi:hypothetical protein